jgi:hypothetical protein
MLTLTASIAAQEKKPAEVPPPGGTARYAKLVVVDTKKENGQVKVSCTLPELQMGKILYKAKSLSVNDGEKKPIATAHGTSKVTFSAPEEQLPALTLDATYIDARSFREKTKDPDKRVDWSMRFLQFKVSDLLKDGYRK